MAGFFLSSSFLRKVPLVLETFCKSLFFLHLLYVPFRCPLIFFLFLDYSLKKRELFAVFSEHHLLLGV